MWTLLAASAHDFCDAQCNPATAHVAFVAGPLCIIASIIELGAAAAGNWRVAARAMAVSLAVLVVAGVYLGDL